MKVKTSIKINAPKDQVWKVVTDDTQWEKIIKAVLKVEVLENPKDFYLGFKWAETRVMFGKRKNGNDVGNRSSREAFLLNTIRKSWFNLSYTGYF